jgi:hypothetical protein
VGVGLFLVDGVDGDWETVVGDGGEELELVLGFGWVYDEEDGRGAIGLGGVAEGQIFQVVTECLQTFFLFRSFFCLT